MLLNCLKFQMPFTLQLQIWQDSVGNQPAKKRELHQKIQSHNLSWKITEKQQKKVLTYTGRATSVPLWRWTSQGTLEIQQVILVPTLARGLRMLQVQQPSPWQRSKQHRLAPPRNANHCLVRKQPLPPVSLRPGVNTKVSSSPMGKKKPV